MPNASLSPGVYVEELPSGTRTIQAVATAITAFVGRTPMGAEEPTLVDSYSAYASSFGGLDPACTMRLVVRDFFTNGGRQAVILRLFKPSTAAGARDRALIVLPNLVLVAASRGSWANALRVRIEPSALAADLFTLSVCHTPTGEVEVFPNLSVKEGPRRVDRVLASQSSLLRVETAMPASAMPAAHAAAGPGAALWADDTLSTPVSADHAAQDSEPLDLAAYLGDEAARTGLHALGRTKLFNLLCIPPDTVGGDTAPEVYRAALDICVQRRAMLIVDAPAAWQSPDDATDATHGLPCLGIEDVRARNAALYFPRLAGGSEPNASTMGSRAACGAIAGLMARTDAARGVWKAPAGTEATLRGVQGPALSLNDAQNGLLNRLGVNCLRRFPTIGTVAWGARTLRGADPLADEYKYIPVRRMALHIEESLYRGLQWVVFEANGEPLWAQIRLAVGGYLQALFTQGAFQGRSPKDAYFVRCDLGTTTDNDIALGLVNIHIGFAPLKPAEFVILKVQTKAGQAQG
ncbi:MAG: phage tail sheath family protein [Burkholderiales bacterium]|nr:phage tail sheath family protein [Burkholderiales bacterium]